MQGRRSSWRWVLPVAILLAPVASHAQPAQQTAPGGQRGPVSDFRHQQPTPAEVEAREKARGLPQPSESREAKDVDQLYRELMGTSPQPPARSARPPEPERR
jgi:hypothetical protein